MCEPNNVGSEYKEEEEQSYIVRKLMFTPKQKEDNQRHRLFWTRCTIGGRCFDLIMDSGSYENIISKGVVEALKLQWSYTKILTHLGGLNP